jgi:hypothetical protein
MTMDMLPVEVLLTIFDFCQLDSTRYRISYHPGSEWHSLVHVCQQWQYTVFTSPHCLDLTLFCTHGMPVRRNLGC